MEAKKIKLLQILSLISSLFISTLSIADITDGLIARYSFNQGSDSELTDDTANRNNGLLFGNSSGTEGKYGQALLLSGSGDYAQVTSGNINSTTFSELSISVWVKPTTSGLGHQYIVSNDRDCCDSPGQGGFGLRINKYTGFVRGEIWLESTKTRVSVVGNTAITPNQWSHIAFTFNGNQLKIYVDGQLDGIKDLAQSDTIQPQNKPLTIGVLAKSAPVYYGFTGKIDELKIYQRTLLSDEISQLYSAIGGEVGLTFYEPFDSQNTIVANGGPNAADGEYAIEAAGRYAGAVSISSNAQVNFPTDNGSGNTINPQKGALSFWFKPNWDGSEGKIRYLFQMDGINSGLRVFFYKGETKNYFVFRYDGQENCGSEGQITCFREVSTSAEEPDTIMSWEADEWHHIEVIWDLTGDDHYLAYVLDKNIGEAVKKNIDVSFVPTSFSVGSKQSNGSNGADGWIDELKIYAEPTYNITDNVNSYTAITKNNGSWQPHETIYNAPFDAPVLAPSIAANENIIFYQTPEFTSVFEGTVPEENTIANTFTYESAKDDHQSLFFNVYSRIDLNNTTISVSEFTNGTDSIPATDINIRIVKNWWQAGSTAHRSFYPVYTPELLLYDDRRFNWDQQEWSHSILPSHPRPANNEVYTDIPHSTSKQFMIDVYVGSESTPGIYTGTVTLTSDQGATKQLTIQLSVTDIRLDIADKDFIIYHRGNPGLSSGADKISESRYDKQIADIRAHGFNSIHTYVPCNTTDSNDPASASNLDKLVSAGFSNIIICGGYTDNEKHALEHRSFEPFFYGVDEPNSLEKMIGPDAEHLQVAKKIHDGDAKVITAISKTWYDHLNNPNHEMYDNHDGRKPEVLDYANISVYSSQSRGYFEGLLDGTTTKQGRQSYYWQMMQEDPRVNRYLTGYHLWLTGMNGIYPYVYQHVSSITNPYDDFDPWSAKVAAYRDHLVTYPSIDGPIGTIEWEALREGIDDYRYLQTWEKYKNQLSPAEAQISEQIIEALLNKYRISDDAYSSILINEYNLTRQSIRDEILRIKLLLE